MGDLLNSSPPPAATAAQVARLAPAQRSAVAALLAESEAHDGAPPLSEQARLHLDSVAVNHLLGQVGDRLAGYGQVTGDVSELAVAPRWRQRGAGGRLVQAALEAGARQFWAHGNLPGARALAARHGMSPVRSLLRMVRDAAQEVPAPSTHLRIDTFRPADAPDLLRVNGRAFASHPEQGGWTAEDLATRLGDAGFDPAGLLIARGETGALAGFHWTKVHRGTGRGEVYVLGVDPGAQGTGVGRALLLAGLAHLRARGVPQIELYVEGDAPARAMYERAGFAVESVDVLYEV